MHHARGATADGLRGENYGVQARRAHHVDRAKLARLTGSPAPKRDLPGDIHAEETSPQHVPDDHRINARRVEARERRLGGGHA